MVDIDGIEILQVSDCELLYNYDYEKCESVHFSVISDCNPMDCSPQGSSVHGILQARILEWVTISFSLGSSGLRDQIWSPTLQVDSLLSEPPGKSNYDYSTELISISQKSITNE